MKTDAKVRTVHVTFRLGETVEETTVDFRKVASVFTLEDAALLWSSTDKRGITTVVRRRIENGEMVVNMEVEGVAATAKFKKQTKK